MIKPPGDFDHKVFRVRNRGVGRTVTSYPTPVPSGRVDAGSDSVRNRRQHVEHYRDHKMLHIVEFQFPFVAKEIRRLGL